MKLTFRWYGDSDPVTLEMIRQIPAVSGVVSAVYDGPAGAVWSNESILRLKEKVNSAGLELPVVESVPVHEKIKLGLDCDELIDNYCENIRRLGRAGVKVICYNFMPVFDWLRSELSRELPDGSRTLAYDHGAISRFNPAAGGFSLPGWAESYTGDQLQELLESYKSVDAARLWDNLAAFLRRIIPVAEAAGVKMALHPDDPPWPVFNLPRIIVDQDSLARLLSIVDSPANGLTFCTGSLGASPANDLPAMIKKFARRIHFVHLRNVLITGHKSFIETAHPSSCGSLDMYRIVAALVDSGFDGYVRADHGRMIWGESGRPGYGLYDRALGAAYITGLFEAVEKGGAERERPL